MNKVKVIILVSLLLSVLIACSSEEEKNKRKYQEDMDKALAYIEQNNWENAQIHVKEVPNDFSIDVQPLKSYIEANIAVSTENSNSDYEKNSMGLRYLEELNLDGVNKELADKIVKLRDELQTEVNTVIQKAEKEEKTIVEQAYDLLWNRAKEADGDEYKKLLGDVKSKVSNYEDFRSGYKVDAHILYLYAEQSLLIQSYRDNMNGNAYNGMGEYDNYETYGQIFADKHKSTLISHLQELDPSNQGMYLPEHVLSSLKNGLENFFYVTEDDWSNIYSETEVDWTEIAKNEATANKILRETIPQIGMSADEVIKTKWGRPEKINKTTTSFGVSEQWVYPNFKYVYLDDGFVTAIQE